MEEIVEALARLLWSALRLMGRLLVEMVVWTVGEAVVEALGRAARRVGRRIDRLMGIPVRDGADRGR